MTDEQYVVELKVDLNSDIGPQLSQQLGAVNNQFSGFDKQIGAVQRQLDGAGQSNAKLVSGLASTRYALYDVSQTLAVMGAGLLALPVATYGVAIAWERDFANVVRTSQATGSEIQQLRNDFMDLASEIPASSSELAKIGTLAGQLGIRKGDIADFTETVAKFSATTDVSAEKAAEGFGRLNSLLPDVQGNFQGLGSAVLKVGVNSVATESAILKTTTQISAMSRFAGLTTGTVIGLAAALASVGVQPELARGTVTRTFTLMGQAVSAGGEDLKKFAKIAGVSSDEFASAFGTSKFDPIFLKFINGLHGITQSGGDANAAIRDLGITSVRDVPALLNLSAAADSAGKSGGLLNQTIRDGLSGLSEATTLNEQYGQISQTVAAKLQVLTNNFQNLLVTIGQGGGIFGGLLDALNGFLKVLNDIAANPVANFFLQLGVVISGLLGIFALLTAGAVAALGSVAAMTTALVGLQTGAGGASVSLATLTGIMASTGSMGAKAAAGINIMATAIKGLGIGALIGGVAAGLGFLADGVINLAEDMFYAGKGATTLDGKVYELSSKIREVKEASAGAGKTTMEMANGFQTMGATFNTGVDNGGKWISMLDELATGTNEASGALKVVSESSKITGISVEDMIQKLPGVKRMFEEQGLTVNKTAEGLYVLKDATGQVANAQEYAQEKAELFGAKIGLTGEEMIKFQENLLKGSQGFFSYGDMLKGLQDQSKVWAEQQAIDAGLGKDAWKQFYDGSSVSIGDFSTKLQEQIDAQGAWASDIGILANKGATAFASELARLGPEGAALARDAVNATDEELKQLETRARIAAFLASTAYTDQFIKDLPLMKAAFAAGGIEAVNALVEAQVSGAPGAVQEVINKYNIQFQANPMKPQADTTEADNEVQRFRNRTSAGRVDIKLGVDPSSAYASIYELQSAIYATRASIPVGLPRAHAAGGYISGPGTGTSDSIPARLSNGEFVVRAASVQKYGVGYLNDLNQGRVRRYAAGGSVSSSSSSSTSVASPLAAGITELGPRTLKAMGGIGGGNVNIMLDDVAISRAAERGNAVRRRNGEI